MHVCTPPRQHAPAPRHGAYPAPEPRTSAQPGHRRPRGGERARHRTPATAAPRRTPTGSYPPTTRTQRHGPGERRHAPLVHRRTTTENTRQEAESGRGGTPVRHSFVRSFSNFRSIVHVFFFSPRARTPRALAPDARPGEFPQIFTVSHCYHCFRSLCLAKRRFRRPFDLLFCVFCAFLRRACARRSSPRAGQRSPVVCMYVYRFHRDLYLPNHQKLLRGI